MSELQVVSQLAGRVLREILTWPEGEQGEAILPALTFASTCMQRAAALLAAYDDDWKLLLPQDDTTLSLRHVRLCIIRDELRVSLDELSGPLRMHLCAFLHKPLPMPQRRALARILVQARELLKRNWDQHEKWTGLERRAHSHGAAGAPEQSR